MKELVKKVTSYIKNMFKSEKQRSPKPTKKHRYILRMDALKMDLKRVLEATDERKKEAEPRVIKLSDEYETVFKAYDSAYKENVKGYLSDTDLLEKKKETEPVKASLNEAVAELDKLKEFEKEQVIKITGEMASLKHKFVIAIASESSRKMKELESIKKDYMQKLSQVGEEFQEVKNTEGLIEGYLTYYGLSYSKNMMEEYEALTEETPVTVEELAFTEKEVTEILIGRKLY
ncbi:hypothetical protein [Rossellomorea sp. NRS-1567]|uniref:hypothetical protein n=1 Tax=Rossellomorea sp. NRS-1567 TaxID=3233901 RepID=UPI003D2BD03D